MDYKILNSDSKIRLCLAVGSSTNWVKLIPSLNPSDHGIGELVKVRINLAKLFLNLLRQFDVAFLDRGAIFRESRGLEERNDLFLPEDTLVLLPQVHKWIASFAVIDVWQTGLHS